MKRNTLNFIVDLLALLALLSLAFTGFIVRYILPAGTGGLGRQLHNGRGREHIKQLWEMSRHEWGDIHFYIAVVFVILMLVHIVLHWGWIKHYFESLFVKKWVG